MSLVRGAAVLCAGLAAGVAARLLLQTPDGSGPVADRTITLYEPGAEGGPRSATAWRTSRPNSGSVLAAHGASRYRLLLAWLPDADEAELSGMADRLAAQRDDKFLDLRLLMARWAEVNPAGLMAWAAKEGTHNEMALEAWARVDFGAAWKAAAKTELLYYRGAALLGLTATDPAQCLDVLRADPSLLNFLDVYSMENVLTRLAAQDPAGTAALLKDKLQGKPLSPGSGVALAWVKKDPAAAIAWIGTLPKEIRGDTARDAAAWLAEHAPEYVAALVEHLPAGGVRSTIAAVVFENLARTDPSAAWSELEKMPDGNARQYRRALLMKELVRAGDDEGAIALASQLRWCVESEWVPDYTQLANGSTYSGYDELDTALTELMRRVAAKDPAKAADLLATSGRIDAGNFLAVAMENDPAAVANALMARKNDPSIPNYSGSIVQTWAATDPGAAAAWLASSDMKGEERMHAKKTLISTWGDTDPDGMLRWAGDQPDIIKAQAWNKLAGRHPDYTVSHLDTFFAARQADALPVLLFSLRLPEQQEVLRRMPDDLRADLSPAMSRWLAASPEEASQWVSDLPPGERRDSATLAMAKWLTNKADYAAAIQWSATLPATDRAPLMKDAVGILSHTNPAAATAAVRAANLPAEETTQWLNFIQNSRPAR